MTVKLVSITPDVEKTIAYCARVSSPNQDNPEIAKLIKYCYDHGHFSIFEMGNMVVEVKTSRAISAQILRHRSFSFQEFSQRYSTLDESGVEIYAARRQDKKNKQNSIDDISAEIQQEWLQRQQANWKQSFEHYQWALDNGIAKECARMVLPLQSSTKIYMNGTVRSWIHYIQARTDPSTQKEHRDVANEIREIFINELPVISEAMGWK